MRRRRKLAMALLSGAVLAGAWLTAAYMETDAAPGRAERQEEPERITLAAVKPEELRALSWSWEGETVNLSRDGDGRWRNADDGTCPVDSAPAEELAAAAASVTARLAIRAPADLDPYGLGSPALTVIAATASEIRGYDVGDGSPTGEYYLRVHGEDTVYLADGGLAEAFRVGLRDLLALETVPRDIAAVRELSVRSAAESYTVAWDSALAGWRRTDTDPQTPLEEAGVRALYELLTELELTDCVTWNGRPEDYGLVTPQISGTVTYLNTAGTRELFTLEFGDYTEGGVYARFAGSSMIFRTPGAAPDGLMYPRWDQMTPRPVLTLAPDDLASVTVTLDGERLEIARLEESVERAMTQQEGTVTVTETIYSLNGWVLDTQRMNGWLESFSKLTAEGAAPAGEGREELFSVTFAWKDTEAPVFTLTFRSYDSARCLCLAEDARLLVPRGAVDQLIAQARSLLQRE